MAQRDEWFFRIKAATRDLREACGDTGRAADIAGVSRSLMGRYCSTTDPDLISLSAAAKLEAECGIPAVSQVLAERSGFRLVRMSDGAQAGCLLRAHLNLADELGDVSKRIREASEDGEITPAEAASIDEHLADVQAVTANARNICASIRSGKKAG